MDATRITLAPARAIFAAAMLGMALATTAIAQTSGNTVALSEVLTGPFTEGRVTLWSNGETQTFGHPQTQADGTQVFPVLVEGGAGTSGVVYAPEIEFWSLDATGLKLYKIEGVTSTVTYSPTRTFLPPSMTIGKTSESVYTQTAVSAVSGATTTQSVKELTTIYGFEPVVTQLGTYQGLKISKQYLTALPDGTFPAAATQATRYYWYGSYASGRAGKLKAVTQNADGSISFSQTRFEVDTRSATAPVPGTALSGTAIALTDILSPSTEGQMSLWSNGERRIYGRAQTLSDGTKVYPRLAEGGASTSGAVSLPEVTHWSFDANGLKLYKAENAANTVTYSPARLYLPPSLTIGQTYESIYTQTIVSAANGATTTKNMKALITLNGFETVATPTGNYQALKLTEQYVVASTDGTYPSASTQPPTHVWFGTNGLGTLKIVAQNADGTISRSQTQFGQDTLTGTPPAQGAALSGSTVALSDISSPFVEGKVTLWSNGEKRTWGHPQTLADGTQVFPRLHEGGATTSSISAPAVQYWSTDANGTKIHRIESATSTITFAPARLYLAPSLTIGQTYESVFVQSTVSTANGATTTKTIKHLTTVVGFDTVETTMGAYQALKVAEQYLGALPDGTYPAASTQATTYVWYGTSGVGALKIINQNADGTIASSQTRFGQDTLTGTGQTTASLVSGWNLLGNGLSNAITVSSALGDAAKVSTVWKWNASSGTWAFYTPTLGDGGVAYAATKGYTPLTTINGGEGFWVNAKSAFSIPLSGNQVPTSTFADGLLTNALPSGWGLIAIGDNKTPRAFANAVAVTPPTGETAVAASLTTLWAWDATLSGWNFFAPSLVNAGTQAAYIASKSYFDFGVRKLEPTMGFWVNRP